MNRYTQQFSKVCIVLLLLGSALSAKAQIVSNYAGSGFWGGFTGDGGPATAATMAAPWSLAIDGSCNLYITDYAGGIRKIDANGIITTFAGIEPTAGYSGDGGPATAAALSIPVAIAVDQYDNVYVADGDNNVIRKIDAGTGIITTVVGNGYGAGLGYGGYSGDGGAATAAELYAPFGLAIDKSGNIYIADALNDVIRKVDVGTDIITTIAGSKGSPGCTGNGGPATAATLGLQGGLGVGWGAIPTGMVVDASNNLYFSNLAGGSCIRKIDLSSGIISVVAGIPGTGGYSGDGGPATAANLGGPSGLALDASGNLYVNDHANNRIRKIDASSGIISTIIGDGTNASTGDGGPATAAEISSSVGCIFNSCGDMFFTQCTIGSIRVRKITNSTPTPITGPSTLCDGTTITLSDATTGGTWSSGATAVATVGITSGVVTGIAPGTAIITYTTCCFAVYDTINIIQSPTITGVPNLCLTLSGVTMHGSPAGGTWSSSNTLIATIATLGSTGNGNLNGVSAGTATLTYTSTNGCFATIVATVTPRPDACISSSLVSGLYEFDFTGTGGATVYYSIMDFTHTIVSYGSVLLTGGGTAIVPASSIPDVYRLCIDSVELNGCFWAGCNCSLGGLFCCASINPLGHKQGGTTGIGQQASIPSFTIVPNPNKGVLTIKGALKDAANSAAVNIEVTDVLGKKVYSNTVKINNGIINNTITLGAEVPNGVYMLKVKNDDATEVIRFTLDR